MPKVYANGTVKVECSPDPSEAWAEYSTEALTPEDKLGAFIHELVAARADVLAIPEARRNATERTLLALVSLVLFGYGISE